jgi:hypothetical protein
MWFAIAFAAPGLVRFVRGLPSVTTLFLDAVRGTSASVRDRGYPTFEFRAPAYHAARRPGAWECSR